MTAWVSIDFVSYRFFESSLYLQEFNENDLDVKYAILSYTGISRYLEIQSGFDNRSQQHQLHKQL